MSKRTYYVYILTNRAGVLYVGVTNDLERRIMEHRSGLIDGFSRKYNVTRLVYFEDCGEVWDAIAREKQIKGWRRSKKLALISGLNREWADLAVPSGKCHPERSEGPRPGCGEGAALRRGPSAPAGPRDDTRAGPCDDTCA